MGRDRLRAMVDLVRRTPLHPQWLLGARRAVTARIRSLPPGRVLDIGCATRWVEQALRPGSEYVGIDHYATGTMMYGARPDVIGDAASLPLGNSCVDAVVMLEVLEHLRHPHEALLEIARVLRPGGRLLLSMPFLYPIHDAPHDYQRYTLQGLTREIESAGLRVEEASPNLGSAQTAGLIACIAMGGMSVEALRLRSPSVLLLPLVAVAVPVINLMAWIAGKLLPTWPAITAGYAVVASRP